MTIAWAGVGHCVWSDGIKLRCVFVPVRSYCKWCWRPAVFGLAFRGRYQKSQFNPLLVVYVVINSINLLARVFPAFEPRSHYHIDPSLFIRPNFTLPPTERRTCIRTASWPHPQASSAQPCYSWSCRRSHPEPWPAWAPRQAR